MGMTKVVDIKNFKNNLDWRNKLGRLLWNITYLLFFRTFSLSIFSLWRIFLLRCFGAKIHSKAMIHSSVKIWAPWNLTMQAHSCLASHVNCYNTGPIYIGHSSTVSQGAYLCPGTHDIEDALFPMIPFSIIIEDQVWIASEAFIGPKVHIGQGAVVGARAAVFKNVEPWTVVGGNPAKFIKKRVIKK